MITRRDLLVAVFAIACTVGVLTLTAQTAPIMHSAVYGWNSVPDQPNATGSSRDFFNGRTATLDQLYLHVSTLKPGAAPHQPHRHPNEELLIIKEGSLECLLNGEWTKIGRGSVFFIASNELHGVRNPGPGETTYYVLGWRSAATPAN